MVRGLVWPYQFGLCFFSKIYNDPELKMSKDGFVKPASLDPNLDMDCSDYTEELEASEQGETDLFY